MELGTTFSPKKGLHLLHEEECMLTKLYEELCLFEREHLKDLLIVLPTHRLGTILLAMLTQKWQAIQAPTITTWDGFIEHSSHQHVKLPKKPLPDISRELMLSALLKEKKYSYLSLGFEHEILQFFGEIIDASLSATAFKKMRDVFLEDIYRSQDSLQALIERVDELEALFVSYRKLVGEKGFVLKQEHRQNTLQCLRNYYENKQELPWRWVYISCFTTFKQQDFTLLENLVHKKNTSIWLTRPLSLLSKKNSLQEMIDNLHLGGNKKTSRDTSSFTKEVIVRSFSSPLEEVKKAIEIARDYVAAGCLPAEIALFITNERMYSDLIKSFIQQDQSLQANIAVSSRLGQTIGGTWFSLLMKYLTDGQQKDDLLAFILHPMTYQWLNIHGELKPQDRFIICSKILSGQEECSLSALSNILEDESLKTLCTALEVVLKPWFEDVTARQRSYTLCSWYKKLKGLFRDFQDQQSTSSTDALLDAVAAAMTSYDVPLTARDFVAFVREKIFSLEVRSVGYPLQGLQVLRLTESRYVPFRVAIVLGCVEGNFPQSLPKDYLVDDWLKRRIGLPGWEYIESLEDTTFQLLISRVERVELFYPQKIHQEPTVPSRFIETLKAKKRGLVVLDQKGSKALSTTYQEKTKTPEVGNYLGDREKFFKKTSAVSLQYLLTCPYRYLLHSLKAKGEKLFEDKSLLKEGLYLHQVLEAFFTSTIHGKILVEPFQKKIVTTKIHHYINNRLLDISNKLAYKGLSATLYYHLKFHSWPLFASYLEQFYAPVDELCSRLQTNKIFSEFRFGSSAYNQAQVMLGDHRQTAIEVTGVVDNLLRFEDSYVLLDFKRNRVFSQKEMLQGQDPQLLLYSLALSCLNQDPLPCKQGVVGYWSVLEGKWYVRGVGEEIKSQKRWADLYSSRTSNLSEQVTHLKTRWQETYHRLVVEKKAFSLEENKGCKHCSYENICQYKQQQVEQVAGVTAQ